MRLIGVGNQTCRRQLTSLLCNHADPTEMRRFHSNSRDRSGRMVNVKEALENGSMDKNGHISGRNLEKAIEDKTVVIEAEALVPLNEGNKIIQVNRANQLIFQIFGNDPCET